MKYACILSACLLAIAAETGFASHWYIAPDGKSTNSGTQESTWDIASTLNGKQKIAAGETIYLMEGTYRRRPKELFEIRLVGTEEAPIHIRPIPAHRVRIDGGLSVQSPSAHVWVHDLEIVVSEPRPKQAISPGSHPKDLNRPWGGVHMFGGNNCKYINLIIHNCNQGISCWKGEINPEIYGCIIYDNGWLGTDRGHGHCIYTQNDEGVKTISNCIMSCLYDGTYTLHAYGSERAYVNNYLIEENIFYNKGPFLIGGGRPSYNIRVFRNYLYNVDMRIGYAAPYNENCQVRDNIIIHGGLDITRYNKVIREGNVIIKSNEFPVGTKSVLLPNRFDPNRAHLVVYNWDSAEELKVRTKPFLKNNDSYLIMDPQNCFGTPITQGTCRSDTIRIPVKNAFEVFIVIKSD
ncbi:MAG: right-handed parallel beta-helix repeat-containing protein [Planctomycetota bacterium]|jgi:hypothetical protein